MSPDGKQLPHNTEAEQAFLGSIIMDEDAAVETIGLVEATDFYHGGHRTIYEAVAALSARNAPIDYLTVSEELRRQKKLDEVGGVAVILNLVNATPTSINAAHYAKIVGDAAARRRLISAAAAVSRMAYDETEDIQSVLSTAVEKVMGVQNGRATGPASPGEYIGRYRKVVAEMEETGVENRLPFFIPQVHEALGGGIEFPSLFIVLAQISVGKSDFILNQAFYNSLVGNIPFLLFTLEMAESPVLDRLVSMYTGIDNRFVKRAAAGWYESPDLLDVVNHSLLTYHLGLRFHSVREAAVEAIRQIEGSCLQIDTTTNLTAAMVRQRVMSRGVDVWAVDHALLMERPGRDTVVEMDRIFREFKNLTKDTGTIGFIATQIPKEVENRESKRPRRTDAKYGGEQHADEMVGLHRIDDKIEPTRGANSIEVALLKNRNGPVTLNAGNGRQEEWIDIRYLRSSHQMLSPKLI